METAQNPIPTGVRNALRGASRRNSSLTADEFDDLAAGIRLLSRTGLAAGGATLIRRTWRRANRMQRVLIATFIHQARGTGRESQWLAAGAHTA